MTFIPSTSTSDAPSIETMRAAVKVGDSPDVVVRSVPRPKVEPGLVEIQVSATGICGTDMHIIHNEYDQVTPVILGHEITGVVTRTANSADDHWLGRQVACETYFSTCETCSLCRGGRRNLCRRRRSLGSFENGGFAEFVVMPAINLHGLPADFDETAGALMEPLACVTQCLLRTAIVKPGRQVLVTGPGTMGLLAGQVAKAGGASVTVLGLESDGDRLAVAKRLGLDTAIGSVSSDAFDVVIECSGKEPAARSALQAAARGGHYVQVGIFGDEISLPFDHVLYKELTVSSGFASTPDSWTAASQLVTNQQVKLSPLITKSVPLSRFTEAVATASRAEGLKTVVTPREE